ncbi:MAG: hypothetical protein R3D29_15655 [Nitratireductor sp.]
MKRDRRNFRKIIGGGTIVAASGIGVFLGMRARRPRRWNRGTWPGITTTSA